jgi:hypothetical protein
VLFTSQGFATTQQFGVDLREFLDLLLELAEVFDPLLRGLLLEGCFEEKFVDVANGQALGQVVERAMFISSLVTVAVGFATTGEPLDQ